MNKLTRQIDYGAEIPGVECPFGCDWIEFTREGEPVHLDCRHMIDDDGESATFVEKMDGDLWDFHHSLLRDKRIFEPNLRQLYAIGFVSVGDYYVRRTHKGKSENFTGFKSRSAAAWWCVENVLRLRGEMV